jgi:microsomal dipeptidase-like Zn-dependent dipeptidase
MLRALVAVALGSLALAGTAAAQPRTDLGGRCVQLQTADGRLVTSVPNGYDALPAPGASATRFYLKATGLGTYMLYDDGGQLLTAAGSAAGRSADAGPGSEWRAVAGSGGAVTLSSTATKGSLTASGGRLALGSSPTSFRLVASGGCTPFPDAGLDATGTPARGSLSGFVDAHLHITADMRAGGRVIHGEAFDRFGIPTALGNDAADHGADGSLDVTGNLLRTGLPFGTHDTHGWPTFAGWPTNDTQTHQQTYYVWLQRAWMAGERLVVAQTVDDRPICEIEPLKRGSCDETRSIKAQIRRLKAMQDYVDAQSGGPGRGWFRLVYSPAQARRTIEAGRLAVVIGIESSDLFGCSERARCTHADVDRGIRDYHRLGVRGMFVAHWLDNGFAGAALEGGAKGAFINVFNRFQNGKWLKTGHCPGRGQGEEVRTLSPVELSVLSNYFPATKPLAAKGMPTYPAGKQCNTRGLTPLGRYLVGRLMANHMLIEVDHLSERARDTVLSIAEQAHYPLVSSHNGTGGEWTPAELRRLHRVGGFAAVTPDQADQLAAKITRMSRYGFPGVGLGTDTGGFASLPGPRSDAAQRPLAYPFKSFDGRVTFAREATGERTFDLGTDGVAHYGLLADLLADVQQRDGRRPLAPLFRSAAAYLQMWQRAYAR